MVILSSWVGSLETEEDKESTGGGGSGMKNSTGQEKGNP